MHLSNHLDDSLADDGIEPELLRDAYHATLRELRDTTVNKSGRLYYLRLWRSLSPEGNIYRYNGLFAESLKHSDDLWDQLRILAVQHEAILGGTAVGVEERADCLAASLLNTMVMGSPEISQRTVISVTVKGIKVAVGDGDMDPAVEVKYSGKLYQTSVKQNAGREVTWDETLRPLPLVLEDEMTCKVLDHDRRKEDTLNIQTVCVSKRLRFEDLVTNADRAWEGSLDLFEDGVPLNEPCGQLFLRIEFTDEKCDGNTNGFKPLEEFLGNKATGFGPFLWPADPESRSVWLYGILIAGLVSAVQFVAPALIVLDKWFSDRNQLRHPHKFWKALGWDELWCKDRPLTEKIHTCMGVVLLTLVLVIISSYISGQVRSADKEARLPTNKFWQAFGASANLWCCVFTALAAPLDFWTQDNATAIALDSMALLFIFSLDDLSGRACMYFGRTDEDFRTAASWNAALLSQCPVTLAHLVKPRPTCAEDFWVFRHGKKYGLLASADSDGDAEAAAPRACEVRLSPAPKDETTRLLSNDTERWYYRSRPKSSPELLPRMESRIIGNVWRVFHLLMVCFAIVFPILWTMVDKPCSSLARLAATGP